MRVTRYRLRWRMPVVALFHALLVGSAHGLAYAVRFDGSIPPEQVQGAGLTVLIAVPLYLVAIALFGVNRGLWRYVTVHDAVAMAKATSVGFVLTSGVLYFVHIPVSIPRSIPIIGMVFVTLFMMGFRLTIRLVREGHLLDRRRGTPVLIYGAGDAANSLLSDIMSQWHATWQPVGVVDDDTSLTGAHIGGVPILGTGDGLLDVVKRTKAREIIIALPSAGRGALERIVARCQATGLPVNTLPSLRALLTGAAELTDIHPIRLEDLLARDPVRTDLMHIRHAFTGKRVLVTGAGGSIGSELCRQVHVCQPDELIMVDRYENTLAAIALEFANGEQTGVQVRPLIGDVVDEARMHEIFSRFRPHFVFHAAAHKHVPMMEWNPLEAVKNNVVGTRTVSRLAHEFNAEHFTLISTDKAVNPTNVMGATKRIAEYVVKGMDQISSTSFCAVRFGNVLGSNGSVVPIFQDQIKARKPVTVTHPEICRFFMTISEAVHLVIQSACVSTGGEIFVLDMGEPVKIVDLAHRMIRMAGYQPGKDIEVAFTGLRPGEKLFEELFDESERVEATDVEKLRRARGGTLPPLDQLDQMIDFLLALPVAEAQQSIPEFLSYCVPSYDGQGMEDRQGTTPWSALTPLRALREQAAGQS